MSPGIQRGQEFAPDERMKKILTDAAAVGSATARALAYRSRLKEAYLYPNSGWQTPFVGGSYEFLHGGIRLLDARTFFFFFATGIATKVPCRQAMLLAPVARAVGLSGNRANVFVGQVGTVTATGPSMSPTTTSGLPLVRSRSAVRRTKSIGVIQGSLLRTCA